MSEAVAEKVDTKAELIIIAQMDPDVLAQQEAEVRTFTEDDLIDLAIEAPAIFDLATQSKLVLKEELVKRYGKQAAGQIVLLHIANGSTPNESYQYWDATGNYSVYDFITELSEIAKAANGNVEVCRSRINEELLGKRKFALLPIPVAA